MKKHNTLYLCFAALLFVGSFVFSFWPLVLVSIMILALRGHTTASLILAFITEILFGSPTGVVSFFVMPFVLFALVCVCIRIFALRYLLERNTFGAL